MKKIILTLNFIFFTNIFGAKIVFDLGGVILNNFSVQVIPTVVYNIGLYNLFNYSVHNPFCHPEKRIFEFEDLVYNFKDAESLWLNGQITSEDFYLKLNEASNNPKYFSFFKNESERRFLQASFKFILPCLLSRVTNINFKSYTVIKQCLIEGHEIFILSNWDAESFSLVKKKCARCLGLFNDKNIYISGNMGTSKPYKKIYDLFLNGDDASQFYFIDDTLENLKIPNELGMHTIHHKDWPSTIQKMQEFKLLKECKPFKN